MRGFCLEVSGDFACFTRPEMKVERVSYDVITPSAARAIFEAILWKPAIRWRITKIEVLNPIQWRCKGMDREGLKRDFGADLIFHGGVDNQYTLPFGSVAEVRQEVLDNYRILGAGGGYILAPCHNIQSITPPENITALYETGYEYGWQ